MRSSRASAVRSCVDPPCPGPPSSRERGEEGSCRPAVVLQRRRGNPRECSSLGETRGRVWVCVFREKGLLALGGAGGFLEEGAFGTGPGGGAGPGHGGRGVHCWGPSGFSGSGGTHRRDEGHGPSGGSWQAPELPWGWAALFRAGGRRVGTTGSGALTVAGSPPSPEPGHWPRGCGAGRWVPRGRAAGPAGARMA